MVWMWEYILLSPVFFSANVSLSRGPNRRPATIRNARVLVTGRGRFRHLHAPRGGNDYASRRAVCPKCSQSVCAPAQQLRRICVSRAALSESAGVKVSHGPVGGVPTGQPPLRYEGSLCKWGLRYRLSQPIVPGTRRNGRYCSSVRRGCRFDVRDCALDGCIDHGLLPSQGTRSQMAQKTVRSHVDHFGEVLRPNISRRWRRSDTTTTRRSRIPCTSVVATRVA